MIRLQVVTVFLACVTFALCLAHALELPGKLRLDKDAYCAVQTIYYPGFTFGGFAEVLGVVAAAALLLMTPTQSAVFPWTLIGFLGLVATHAAYWILTHPVNNFWLKGENLKGLGGRFFKLSSLDQQGDSDQVSEEAWRRLRDRWEYSHVLRALLSAAGLLALLVALTLK
jgi:hypothetical protein